jgi:hypothetical protein
MPMFMAPEIRDGAVGNPACDVYTAGALLYFAVTGQPFWWALVDRERTPNPGRVTHRLGLG